MNNVNNYEVKQRKARKIAVAVAMINIIFGNALSLIGHEMLETISFVMTIIIVLGFEIAGMYYLSKREDVSSEAKRKKYRGWGLSLIVAIAFYTWIEIAVVR